MKPSTVDAIAWVLIYSGLLLAVLGLFVVRSDPALGLWLLVVGLALALAGVLLIWVRSRMGPG